MERNQYNSDNKQINEKKNSYNKETAKIRPAVLEDANAIIEIYNPYILNTTITYEYKPLTVKEMSRRMKKYMVQYPWLVIEKEKEVIGYAYAAPYHERAAFQWDCEISVYVSQKQQGLGIGTILLKELLDVLKKLGYCNVYSLIDYPNLASEKLHKKFGFKQVGIYENIGFKHGAWRSLLSLSLCLSKLQMPGGIEKNWTLYTNILKIDL